MFEELRQGVLCLGAHILEAGHNPHEVLIQIPTKLGVEIELEMLDHSGWEAVCRGISSYADGHRKQIELYGVRVYWKSDPPMED